MLTLQFAVMITLSTDIDIGHTLESSLRVWGNIRDLKPGLELTHNSRLHPGEYIFLLDDNSRLLKKAFSRLHAAQKKLLKGTAS